MRHPTAYCTCWPGATVWLTGLPSSGTSAIAEELVRRLVPERRRVEVLGGGENRAPLTADLGSGREDRIAGVRRIGLVAETLARNGILALVPVIAPQADAGTAVRRRHERSGTPFLEVHVTTPAEVCTEREVKGPYTRGQATGNLTGPTGPTGADDPYEPPHTPDLAIPAHRQRPEESAALLLGLLKERGLA
ncbi:adenylyl-sulfate kinase [Streptomyces sp. NPDC058326]|uniref:adenylyl-sulfate kinase n=1 Tax=Streptomyces sp. NPDC058326 TaxID=3346447 RepID=UPI0036E15B51